MKTGEVGDMNERTAIADDRTNCKVTKSLICSDYAQVNKFWVSVNFNGHIFKVLQTRLRALYNIG